MTFGGGNFRISLYLPTVSPFTVEHSRTNGNLDHSPAAATAPARAEMPQNLSHSSGTHAKGGNSEAANTAILEELEKGFTISDQDNKVRCVHSAACAVRAR